MTRIPNFAASLLCKVDKLCNSTFRPRKLIEGSNSTC